MSKTMAIFGTGPGFGLSVAHRFGRKGYDLALVARNRDRLNEHVRGLDAAGIKATPFVADLTDQRSAVDALVGIQAALGPVDVLLYSAMADFAQIKQPLDIAPDNLGAVLDQVLHTPVALVRQALPDLLERADGGLLFSYGASAIAPTPAIGNVGIAMSALRYYAHLLHWELAPRGVYAGGLAISGFIKGTPAALAMAASMPDVPQVDPDDLADALWEQFSKRSDPDGVVPAA